MHCRQSHIEWRRFLWEGRFGAVHALCVARKGVLLDQPRRDVVGDDDSDAGRVENVIASGDPLGLAGNDSESVVAADDVISDVHLIRENDTEAATVIPFDQILLHGHRARIRNEQSGAEVVEESATQDPNISGFLCAHSGLPIAGEGAVAHLDVVGGVDEATEPSEWFDGSATHQAVEHEVVVAGGDDRWADAIFAPENRRLPSIPRAEHERAFGRTGMDIRPQPERREHTRQPNLVVLPRLTCQQLEHRVEVASDRAFAGSVAPVPRTRVYIENPVIRGWRREGTSHQQKRE